MVCSEELSSRYSECFTAVEGQHPTEQPTATFTQMH